MQPYRFYGLVQGRLFQLQMAIFILVEVIPPLEDSDEDQRSGRDRGTMTGRETEGLHDLYNVKPCRRNYIFLFDKHGEKCQT